MSPYILNVRDCMLIMCETKSFYLFHYAQQKKKSIAMFMRPLYHTPSLLFFNNELCDKLFENY